MTEEITKPTETGGTTNNTNGQGGEPPAKPSGVDARLHEVNEEAKKYRLEAKTLKQEVAALSTQIGDVQKLLELERQQREAAQAQAVTAAKKAAAIKFGLPEAMAERFKGNTPEEIEADAKALAELLPKPQTPAPQASPANPAGGAGQQTERDLSWLPSHPKYRGATFRGGGVVINQEK